MGLLVLDSLANRVLDVQELPLVAVVLNHDVERVARFLQEEVDRSSLWGIVSPRDSQQQSVVRYWFAT